MAKNYISTKDREQTYRSTRSSILAETVDLRAFEYCGMHVSLDGTSWTAGATKELACMLHDTSCIRSGMQTTRGCCESVSRAPLCLLQF